ncbi:nucleoside triphosphate pyrophosphohydrolase [Odoribacter sp. OttesenSCG-928-G04]|nr:nucleoside triphosphate pyrophosphohydrolase [Odoribacter sp. OttesenSCG-928-G04]
MGNRTKAEEAFGELLGIMKTLREKCPWDNKQTLESLRSLSIEEVYELGDAILANDLDEVKKELGDLIMHIAFYAQIGEEKGAFAMGDVLTAICDKLRYRHPHIYGDVHVKDENDVSNNWEKLKLKEKGRKGGVLAGVPVSLPALVKAYRVQDKVRGVGFDWKKREDVWDKVREELGELEDEIRRNDMEKAEEEFGDFMFSIINAARLYGINPENALEKTNRKFINRFNYLEKRATEEGKRLGEMTLDEMDVYWREAKLQEGV